MINHCAASQNLFGGLNFKEVVQHWKFACFYHLTFEDLIQTNENEIEEMAQCRNEHHRIFLRGGTQNWVVFIFFFLLLVLTMLGV